MCLIDTVFYIMFTLSLFRMPFSCKVAVLHTSPNVYPSLCLSVVNLISYAPHSKLIQVPRKIFNYSLCFEFLGGFVATISRDCLDLLRQETIQRMTEA